MTEQCPAGVRQPDTAGVPVHELRPGRALEARDLLRDRGLAVVERLGGRRERAALDDLLEDLQMLDLDHNCGLSFILLDPYLTYGVPVGH
jgi:hypothetical protein